MSVTFAPGTWLEELTGNATSTYADPNAEISQFVQVQPGGVISGGGLFTAKFLGNVVYNKGSTTSSYSTNDGFLIYGLPTPTGTLSTAGVSSVMASQTGTGTTPGGWEPNANYSNGTARNTAVNVVTGSSFTLNLDTVEANLQVTPTTIYHDQDADGDNAQFTIDGGAITVAPHGQTSTTPGSNGEITDPTSVSYGYQNFSTSSPGFYNASGNGAYAQTIDTAGLSIGYHYIEAIAFRHNSDTTAPPVYNDWYETIYVDRGTPSSSIQSFAPLASAPTNYSNRQLDIQSDGTTNSEYAFLNLPSGITNAQILNMISTGSNVINGVTYVGGSAGQTDQNLFAYSFNNLQNGNNVATVVSYRPDGNSTIQRFTASQVPGLGDSTPNGLGLGDLNKDGKINTADVDQFFQIIQSNGQQFNPAADMNGDGVVDANDWLLFDQELQQDNLQSSIPTFNALSPSVPVSVPAGTSYNLQVPVSTATLGATSLGAASTLSITGTVSNTAYSLTIGSTSVSGPVTFVASNNGTGAAVLNIGALNDNGVASALQFSGNGTVNLIATGTLSAATTVSINTGTILQIKANSALGTKGVAITNNGSLVVAANQLIGNLSGPGALTIGNGSTSNTLSLAANSAPSTMSSLSILGTSSLDIGNNQLFINYGSGTDPIASIAAWIRNGYYGLSGPSIISSAIAGDDSLRGFSYGIGYADSADPGDPANLPSGTIEIMFTLLGDANLDGTVNSEDFTPFSQNLNQSGVWDQGDFNYDGTINAEDFTPFSANLNQSAILASPGDINGALLAANNIILTNVPEPVSMSFLALGAAGVLARRRRINGK
jgi:hypothetical protein